VAVNERNVLLNSGVDDVVVVVTRYFGGVKLGTGGLVRAYTGSVLSLRKNSSEKTAEATGFFRP
jgi:putative IMPACT (imprinted ancient) family translation regulator